MRAGALAFAFTLLSGPALVTSSAGELEPIPIDEGAKMVVEPTSPVTADPDAWQFEFRPYLWTLGLDGSVGAQGVTAPLDVGFDDILDNLDFAFAATLEARKGRFGAYLDFNYAKITPDLSGSGPGELFDTIDLDLEQTLVDAQVFWRALEWDRGYLDLTAGVRFVALDMAIGLAPNEAGIRDFSREISSRAIDRIADEVKVEAQRQLASFTVPGTPAVPSRFAATIFPAVPGGGPPITPPTPTPPGVVSPPVNQPIKDRIQDKVLGKVNERLTEEIQNQLDGSLAGMIQDKLGQQAANARSVVEARKALVRATVEERIAQLRAGARTRVAKAAAKARERAEERLAEALEKEITERLPSEVSDRANWVDPHIGFRFRHHLTEQLYLAAMADIGGFGVGSDLTWQVGGGLGYNFSERFAAEIGYRYLSIDYEDDGFVYDVDMSGFFLGAVFRF